MVGTAPGRLCPPDDGNTLMHPDQSGYDIYTGIFTDTILDSTT